MVPLEFELVPRPRWSRHSRPPSAAELRRPYRVCRVCGLEALTEEDLELFRKDKGNSLHGRQNLCIPCNREASRESKCRTTEFCEIFRERSSDGLIRCHFCGEEVTKLEGKDRDSLTIHNLDGNHENWSPDNKVPTHKGCHSINHNTGEKHYAWQGDEASDRAKYAREWRRKT